MKTLVRILVVLFFLFPTAFAFDVSAGEVWLSPNYASTDSLQLWYSPQSWPVARSRTQVIKFFSSNVAPGVANEPTNFSSLALAGAFINADAWGLRIAVESPPIFQTPNGCSDRQGPMNWISSIVNGIRGAGGVVDAVAMDEPFHYALACGFDYGQSAGIVTNYIGHVRSLQPGIRVGDIMPYPRFRPVDILGWTDVMVQWAPGGLDFVHVDINQNLITNEAQFHADLREIRDGLRARGVAFGVILHPNLSPVYSDAEYRAGVLDLWNRVKTALGDAPPHIIIQSWQPGGTMPMTLPESTPSSLTGILDSVVGATTPSSSPAPSCTRTMRLWGLC